MNISESTLNGAYVIEQTPIHDHRGWFARSYCAAEMGALGLETVFVQFNTSWNRQAGTLRGLHYQRSPYGEVKVVRCVRGALFDVIVDLREESPTYLKWFGAELTEENGRSLYVPKGFAHGYLTLVDNTTAFYQVSEFYRKSEECGLRYDDPKMGIEWPGGRPLIISDKDASWPLIGP